MKDNLRDDESDWVLDAFFEHRAARLLPQDEPEIVALADHLLSLNRTPLEIRTVVFDATQDKPLAYRAYYYAGYRRRSLL